MLLTKHPLNEGDFKLELTILLELRTLMRDASFLGVSLIITSCPLTRVFPLLKMWCLTGDVLLSDVLPNSPECPLRTDVPKRVKTTEKEKI